MWIIDNNNTNDIIKKVANTYEINEKRYDNEVIINENEKDIYFDYMKLKFIDVDINKLYEVILEKWTFAHRDFKKNEVAILLMDVTRDNQPEIILLSDSYIYFEIQF